jgi:uncharacterized membrane protein YgcG
MHQRVFTLITALVAAGVLIACWPERSLTQEQAAPAATATANESVVAASSTEARIREELAKETALELNDKSLDMAVKYLAQKYRIPIVLDLDGLKISGIDPTAGQVSIDSRGITLRAVLRAILEPLELDYVIKDEALQITTKDKAAQELATEIYDVRDLIDDSPGSCDYSDLISLLTSTVKQESWAEKGGNGVCQPGLFGTLLVSQTEDTHVDVAAVLSSVRKAKEQNTAGKPQAIVVGESPADRRIKSLLVDKVNLSFSETPLAVVAAELGKQKGITVQIDKEALHRAGIETTLVSQKISNQTLKSALKLILQDMNLAAVIRNESLLITTKDYAAVSAMTCLYPVADLAKLDSTDPLVGCITSTASPDTWQDRGGIGSIATYDVGGPLLGVAQTQEVHDQISGLLAKFREIVNEKNAQAAQAPNQPQAPEKMALRVYEIRNNQTDNTAMTPQEVAEIVQGLVEPNSWHNRPEAYIRGVTGKLIVRQTPRVHREIERVLDKIGAKPPKPPFIPVVPVVGQNGQQPAGGGIGGGGGFGGGGFGGGLGGGGFGGGGF